METASVIFNHVRRHSTAGSFIGNLKGMSIDLALDPKTIIAQLHLLESSGGIKVYYFRGGDVLVKIVHHRLAPVERN